jgi:hypothetical protein
VVAGGYSYLVFSILKTVIVRPAETTRVALLVATDSFRPELGHSIPAGQWGLQAALDPLAGQAGRTLILPLTITS